MKRSRQLGLILMGHAPLLLLGACSDDPQEQQGFYTSVEACKADWNTPADCEKAAAEAAKANEANGRSFTTRDACYAQFGDNCREHPGTSGSTWMPLMEGFLIGRILSSGGGWHSSYYSPVYRTSSGAYTGFSSAGAAARSGTTSGFTSVSGSANHSSVSRGGFGSSSHSSASS